MNSKAITGIILSGGMSRRLGQEKGLAMFQGKQLITYAIEALLPVCSSLLISANNSLEAYKRFGFEVVHDRVQGIGPMGGIATCLTKSRNKVNIVLSCDTPFVNRGLFEFLIDSLGSGQAAVPIHLRHLEPLCAVYTKEVIDSLEDAIRSEQYKMHDFLQAIKTKEVKIEPNLPFYDKNLFANINSRADLNRNYG